MLLYFALLAGAFFVLIVLPQRRRLQAMRDLQANLRVGDDVVTTGGLHGTVAGLGDGVVELQVAPGTVLRFERGAILQRRGGDVVVPDDGGETG